MVVLVVVVVVVVIVVEVVKDLGRASSGGQQCSS